MQEIFLHFWIPLNQIGCHLPRLIAPKGACEFDNALLSPGFKIQFSN